MFFTKKIFLKKKNLKDNYNFKKIIKKKKVFTPKRNLKKVSKKRYDLNKKIFKFNSKSSIRKKIRIRYLLLLALLLSFLTIIFLLIFNFLLLKEPYYISIINYSFNITDNIVGINVNSSSLIFGSIPINGFSKRRIIITPKEDSFLKIEAYGNGSNYLFYNKTLLLKKNNPVNLSFFVFAPNKTGFYKGYIKFIFFKNKN